MYLLDFKLSISSYYDIAGIKQLIAQENWDIDLILFEALSDQGDHGMVIYLVAAGADIEAEKGFGKTAREYGIERGYNWSFLESTNGLNILPEEEYEEDKSYSSASFCDSSSDEEFIGEINTDFLCHTVE